MSVGFNGNNVIPLYIGGALNLINSEDLETIISFPDMHQSAVIEDVSSLHFYSLGPKGLSQVERISREIIEESIVIKTNRGRKIKLAPEQQIFVKTPYGDKFIPAKSLRPGTIIGEFAGNLLTNRIQGEIDLVKEFVSETPPEIPSELYVNNVRNLLLTLGDTLERILEKEEIKKENEQFAPDKITLQQFYLLANKYGLMDYGDDSLYITTKDGNGYLPLTIEINSQIMELLGIFTRYGKYSKSDGHPIIECPSELTPKTLTLIRYLTSSPITYVEKQPGIMEIHFGKEAEGWLFRHVFGIYPLYEKRVFPKFSYLSEKTDLIMFLKYFMDYSSKFVTQNVLRFPNQIMTQQAYYYLRSIGKEIEFSENNNNTSGETLIIADNPMYFKWEPIIDVYVEKQREYFYSIKNKDDLPYYAGAGFILR